MASLGACSRTASCRLFSATDVSSALAASSRCADVGGAFWQSDPDALLTCLASNREGLTQGEAHERLTRDGPNEIEATSQRHILVDLLHRLANPLVAILLVAAAIAGITGDLASFLIILAVVILSTLLDMVEEHRAQAFALSDSRCPSQPRSSPSSWPRSW